ncbi:MAG TPA: hypothetical protein V6C76_17875 [Drouetiella sp.]
MSRKKHKSSSPSEESFELLRTAQAKRNSELLDDEQRFAELLEQADAVDRVMTKNGPPEFDWTSG